MAASERVLGVGVIGLGGASLAMGVCFQRVQSLRANSLQLNLSDILSEVVIQIGSAKPIADFQMRLFGEFRAADFGPFAA